MPPRKDDETGDEGFIGRWSRRKRNAVEPEPPASPDDTPEASATAPDSGADPAKAAITPEELAALPRPEDLMPGANIRAFLRPGVPTALKNAALRRMWLLTPAIRDHADPAVDYAWDWNTPGGVPGSGAASTTPDKVAQMLRALRETPAEHERAATEAEVDAPGGTDPAPQATTSSTRTDAQAEVENPASSARYPRDRTPQPDQGTDPSPSPSAGPVPQSGRTSDTSDEGPEDPPARRPRHGGARPS